MQEETHESPAVTGKETRIAWILGVVAVLIQVLTNSRYGFFRDELYYIATSEHLALGYVDLAPLIAWLLRGFRLVFGDSLQAIRLLPALAFGAEVVLTGYITRELGGRKWAIFTACASVMLAPVVLANGSRLAMNAIEPLFWMGSIYLVLLAKNRQNPKLLVWAGVLLGLGLENKHSTIFFIGALVIGLLATSDRRLVASKWFWIATAIAFALALPNVIWQYQHGFPTLEDLRNVKLTHKNVELPPIPFLLQQIMMLNPGMAWVWMAGLGFLLFHREGKRYRSLGVTYLVFLAVMMAMHGKDYYLAPIYPLLFAAGGAFWERLSETRVRWIRMTGAITVIISGAFSLPMVLPVLPVERVVPYMQALGVVPQKTETNMMSPLPQYFADQFGWEEMVETVAKVYHSLPPEQRAKTAIFTGNYGGAGAIDFFGPKYGLPKAISGHQNYYFWGPRDYTMESLILIERSEEDVRRWCPNVEVGPRVDHPFSMNWEKYNVLICRGPNKPLAEIWPNFKFWN